MPTAHSPLVTFVILNWNQADITRDCLTSLAGQDYDNFRVIVIDNGSTDGSEETLRCAFPWVIVVHIPDNIGYSPGNNVGIELALQQGSDYVFLLNNDTVVAPDMLQRLVDVAESAPEIAMTGPTMYYFDQPETIWCAGNRINWRDGGTTRLQADEHRSSLHNSPIRPVDFVTSCAVCIKRKALETVGMLDERYFIYYEETDWCVRASAQGWQTLHVPEATMWHKVSAAMGTSSPATDYYMNRNVLLFLSKHHHGFAGWRSRARAVGRGLLTIAAYSVKRRGGTRRRNRDARLMALRDAFMGRWGRMGKDVAAICYSPNR